MPYSEGVNTAPASRSTPDEPDQRYGAHGTIFGPALFTYRGRTRGDKRRLRTDQQDSVILGDELENAPVVEE